MALRFMAVDYLETGLYPEDSYSKRVKVNLVRKLFAYESEAALTDAATKLKEAAADVEFDETDCCFMEVAAVVPAPGDAAAHWKQIEDEGSNVLLFGVLQGFFTRADAVSAAGGVAAATRESGFAGAGGGFALSSTSRSSSSAKRPSTSLGRAVIATQCARGRAALPHAAHVDRLDRQKLADRRT